CCRLACGLGCHPCC
uniref:Conotoxin Ar1446 n=1 Tax=Conus araneosus TaxID=101286 RepID=TXM46_CONAO|nr:RecName: Full=Conotoxin Ar1446; AltName: Full=Conotoxin Ar1430 [Conus araneosus]